MIPTAALSGGASAVAVAAQRDPAAGPDGTGGDFRQIFEALSANPETSGEPTAGTGVLEAGAEESTEAPEGDLAALDRAFAILAPLAGCLQPVPAAPVPRREEAGGEGTQDAASSADPGVRWLGFGGSVPMLTPAPGGDPSPLAEQGADLGARPAGSPDLQRAGSEEASDTGSWAPIASAAAGSADSSGEGGAPSLVAARVISVEASEPRLRAPATPDTPDASATAPASPDGIERAALRTLQSESAAPPPERAMNPAAGSLEASESTASWSGQPPSGAVGSGPVSAAEPTLDRPAEQPDRARAEPPARVAEPPAAVNLLAASSLARGEAQATIRPRSQVPEPLAVGTVERIQRAVRVAASGGVEVRVRLEPESLGDVRVAVRWDGGTVSARLEVGTAAVREVLESHLPALRKSLQEQGIPIQQMEVGIRRDPGGGGRERDPWRPTPDQEFAGLDLPGEEGEARPAERPRSGLLDVRI